jgi:hypothetical protein
LLRLGDRQGDDTDTRNDVAELCNRGKAAVERRIKQNEISRRARLIEIASPGSC